MMLCAVAIEVEVQTPPPALRRNGTYVYTSISSQVHLHKSIQVHLALCLKEEVSFYYLDKAVTPWILNCVCCSE